MENPLLDSEQIPVAFSTSIEFPASDTNKSVFEYIPAMMLEPERKNIEASIFLYGLPVFSGSLVYDGVEGGILKYIFTEKSLTQSFSSDIAPDKKESATWDEMHTAGNKYRMPIIIDEKYVKYYVAPLDKGEINDGNCTAKNVKYRNCGYGPIVEESEYYPDIDRSCSFLPAVQVLSLVDFLDIRFMEGTFIKKLFLLLPYGEAKFQSAPGTKTGLGYVWGNHWGEIFKENFPEASIADILNNICKMFCCSIYKQNNQFYLIPANKIFQREIDDILFWDDKISDIYSLSLEPGKKYNFEMGDNSTEGDSSESAHGIDSAYSILSKECPDYAHYKQSLPNNASKIYSARSHEGTLWPTGYECRLYDTELIYWNAGKASNSVETEESFDVKCDFKPVHTVPERLIVHSESREIYDFMAPIIKMPDKEDGRGNDLIVGILSEQDHEYDNPPLYRGNPIPNLTEFIEDTGESLLPAHLYEKFHKEFAEWMGKNRTVVKADLHLSAYDFLDLALYKRVYFRSRDWMIKRLSITFHPKTGQIEASGEFIGL
jgi:hypothetical protein